VSVRVIILLLIMVPWLLLTGLWRLIMVVQNKTTVAVRSNCDPKQYYTIIHKEYRIQLPTLNRFSASAGCR
jgi:hypothetical protein